MFEENQFHDFREIPTAKAVEVSGHVYGDSGGKLMGDCA